MVFVCELLRPLFKSVSQSYFFFDPTLKWVEEMVENMSRVPAGTLCHFSVPLFYLTPSAP